VPSALPQGALGWDVRHRRGAVGTVAGKDVLAEYPAERERWLRFHDERVRKAMREWLEDHDIEPMTAPPERREEMTSE